VVGGRAQLLEALVLASPDAVVVVGDSGRIEMASPAVAALFGYRPEELVGQDVEVLVPEGLRDLHRRHRRSYKARPQARPMGSGLALEGRRKDGTVFPLDVSLAPVAVGGSRLVGAFVRDATERRRGEDLLRYANEISQGLLAGQPTLDCLALAARRGRQLAGAAAAWVAAPGRSGALEVAAADGQAPCPPGHALAGDSPEARALARGLPVLAGDPGAEEGRGLGPALYLPMTRDDGPVGVLAVARGPGAAGFDPAVARALETFASAASIVFSLARARQELERLRLVSEQERIARDLHDTVIQRLFAVGMSLQGLLKLADGPVAERLDAAVEAIDEVIREIRETIFELNQPADAGVRHQLAEVAAEAAGQLGFRPRLAFRGPVEAALPAEALPHLVAVAREALANVARHAGASAAEVVVSADDGHVTLEVADDGKGIGQGPFAGHGLANMGQRAATLGGSLRVAPRRPAGTLVSWRVPAAGRRRGPAGG